jgi:carbon-monoxide dehydrogenase large subunit
MHRIRGVFHGSTTILNEGYGSYHSRAVVMGGSAILNAAADLLKAIRDKAAERLGCAVGDVEIVDGEKVTGPGNKSLPLSELSGLAADGAFVNKKHTWTYGAHAAYVAVDAKIGRVDLLDYVIVEDCGRIINPNMVRGQVIGSAVQGLGGAMLEHLIYDEQGQLLTGSLADYLVPLASDFPVVRSIVTGDYPSPISPLGAKGAGEGGIIAAGGVMANAVADALREFDVQPHVLPLTPTRVWEMVHGAAK